MGDNVFELLRSGVNGKEKLASVIGTSRTSYHNLVKDIVNFDPTCNLGNILTDGESIADKKCSIYEFPTYELIKAIFKIAEYSGAEQYNEMFGGCGLLARAVSNFNNSQEDGKFKFSTINCTDGFYEWNTSGYKFYDVEHECFYKKVTDYTSLASSSSQNYTQSMFVFSWIPYDGYGRDYIKKFLTTLEPKCLIIIGNNYYNSTWIPSDYKNIKFSVKQLCNRDNSSNIIPENLGNCTSHSYVNVFIKTQENLPENLLECELLQKPFELSLKTIIEDMKQNDMERVSLYDYLIHNPLMLCDIFNKMNRFKLNSIPKCIETFDDLLNYMHVAQLISSELISSELIENPVFNNNKHFRQLVKDMNEYIHCSDEQLEKGIRDGTFPEYMKKENALQYIMLEHLNV